MTVYKVVRRWRGKLYSAVVKKRMADVIFRKYGRFWTKRPRGGGALLAFRYLDDAQEFATAYNVEVWEAEGKETNQPIHTPFWFRDWPADTIFCDAIRLKRKL